MIDMALAYNAIIKRPLIHQINTVISMWYMVLKFLLRIGGYYKGKLRDI